MGKVTGEFAKSAGEHNVKKDSPAKRKGQQKGKKVLPTKKMGQKQQKSGGGNGILKKQGSVSASRSKNGDQRHLKLKLMKKKIDEMKKKIAEDKKRGQKPVKNDDIAEDDDYDEATRKEEEEEDEMADFIDDDDVSDDTESVDTDDIDMMSNTDVEEEVGEGNEEAERPTKKEVRERKRIHDAEAATPSKKKAVKRYAEPDQLISKVDMINLLLSKQKAIYSVANRWEIVSPVPTVNIDYVRWQEQHGNREAYFFPDDGVSE